MWSPEFCIRAYRRIRNRRLKAASVNLLRRLGCRHLVVRIDTTNLCNLRCRMCYYSSAVAREPEMMDPALFQKIADDVFPRTRFLYLSCATEPLMNRHFPNFLDVTGKYKVPFTSFCTNGQLLNEKAIDSAIRAHLTEIIFSVDGASAETYEYIRRGASWKKLLQNIRLLQRRKQDVHAEYPVARLNFTCMERNVRELPQLVRLCREYDIENIHVRHLLAYNHGGGEGDMKYQEQSAYLKSFNEVAAAAQKEADRLKVRLFLPDPVPDQPQRPSGEESGREANPYCVIPWFQGIINANGDYRLCSAFSPFGNLRDQTFDEIYGSAPMKELRRRLLRRDQLSCSWKCAQEAYEVKSTTSEDSPTPERVMAKGSVPDNG